MLVPFKSETTNFLSYDLLDLPEIQMKTDQQKIRRRNQPQHQRDEHNSHYNIIS